MFGSNHLISGLDVATGTFALMVFSAISAVVVLLVLFKFLLRRVGGSGMTGALLALGLVVVGSMLAYGMLDRSAGRDQAADRHEIETRAADLTARAIAPGSALACLDAVASTVIENACEKSLFATPEAVAAAVAYVDARFSLLAPSVALAERDPSFQPSLERLRRALEADRFGLVAHVLATRGCSGAECAEIRLLRDPSRVLANMKSHAFDEALGVHALAWQQNGSGSPALASAPSLPVTPQLATTGTAPLQPGPGGVGATGSPKFDFPSASSIPPVSIMSAEPGTPPPAAEPKPPVIPPKRPAAAAPPTPRRHSARDVPPPPPAPALAPSRASAPPPPVQIAPEAAPAQAASPAVNEQHSPN